jgi:hypothetical protein
MFDFNKDLEGNVCPLKYDAPNNETTGMQPELHLVQRLLWQMRNLGADEKAEGRIL